MCTSSESGAISRKVVAWLSVPFILIGLVIGWGLAVRHKHEQARADWKTATLPRLAGLSSTNEDISRELETLKVSQGVEEHPMWVGDHVLLMTNGECLFYSFRHGFNNGSVDHLLLARGSDGRWLYSTYHFCSRMAGVMSDDPPGSISEFATRYSAREFDGKSDVCLQHTWPPKR